MKKVFGWILGILLSPVLLFIVLAILLYLPPVQNWMVDKVTAVASEKTDMDIRVGRVDLSFPLDLSIADFKMIHKADTIADVERLVVDVQLLPLFGSRVVINQLEVSNTRLNTNGFIDAATVKGRFGRLYVSSKGIDLDRQTVEVNGTRLEDARLDIALSDSVPEDTTASEKTMWKIHVDEAKIRRSDVVLHLPGDTMSVAAHFGTLAARQALIDLGTETYTVGNVEWQNGALQYDQNYEARTDGFDYNHLDLANVGVSIDSIYYHDPTLRLRVRQLAFREKSGLQVTGLEGAVALEDGILRLPRMLLQTPYSGVEVMMDLPLSLTSQTDPGLLALRLNAQLGKQDLTPFMTALPHDVVQRWPDRQLAVAGRVTGNLQSMAFDGVEVSLPTAFHLKADGTAGNLGDTSRMTADVRFSATTQNLGFLTVMAGDMGQHGDLRLPPMSLQGRAQANGPQYQADVTAREGIGTIKAKGSFHATSQRYAADISLHDVNVHHFLPHDSLYTVSATLTANGQGTDMLSPRTTLVADARIPRLRYGQLNFDSLSIAANVHDGRALVDAYSRNALIRGKMAVDALLDTRKIEANVTTDFRTIDLYRMQLVEKPLAVGLCGQVDITSDMKLTHYVSGLISDITVRDSSHTVSSEFVGLHVRTTADTTLVRAQSGDFIVKVDGSGDYEALLRKCTILGDSVAGQLRQRIIDQPALMRLLPQLTLHVESKRDNPIATLLKTSQGIDFQDLLFDMSSSPVTGLNGKGYLHALTMSDVRLDTINFRLTQRKNRLSFGGQIRNNKRNPRFVFNALFDGILQERGATFGVRYFDAHDKLGARIGAQAEMADSGLHIHLIPERPMLGYKEYTLNKDNFLLFGFNKKVHANIHLVADDGMGMKVYSENSNSTNLQDLTVSLHQINLGEITSVIPYAPRMTGTLNGDYHIVQDAEEHISVVSDMNVRQMVYEGSPIGNVSTELVYLQKEDDAHAVEARLLKDNKEIGLFTGTYFNAGEGSLDAHLLLERFPLSIVNGFVSDHLFGLYGYSEGEMTVKGSLSRPQVDGEVYLDSSYVESVPYGVRLRFDNDPVRVVNSNLLLENFTVYAHNENPLNIMGNVDFHDLDHILINVRMRAKDFQLIGVKEQANSVAYGKAFVDIFATARGPVDDLTMRGRLNVLGSTDMGYILRDSPISTDNQLDNLVKFKDFSDTTQIVVQRPALTGLHMDMTVDVSKGAHIIAYLNTDHSNYIDLLGGGTLRMSYNPADNLWLMGRYTLSNGEMKYALPIIPLKTFTIRDGSYVEFTGDVTNPTLNITATERTKATVTGSNGAGRSVDFDCGVAITRTLNDMGLQFILDAPEDMQLHSELQSMGAEQRGKLAVTMLTTGMYLADGNTNAFSMNSALSSFLSSEISNLTGNALRTLDMSFGMENGTDASGNSHTDYSFKFAKRFLNNRLKVTVGGKVTSGAEMPNRNKSFFDNVSLEYRLDNAANKYLSLFYQNNSYDWLDGYTQKYGGGFIWRRSLQKFTDIFRFKEQQPMQLNRGGYGGAPADSLKNRRQ